MCLWGSVRILLWHFWDFHFANPHKDMPSGILKDKVAIWVQDATFQILKDPPLQILKDPPLHILKDSPL